VGEVEKRVWGVVSRTAGNTIAPGVAALCAMVGIPIGESTALGALAGSLTEEVVGQLHRDRAERVARFGEIAAAEAGCTLDELLREAAAYPEKLELLAQAVEGASRALSEEQVDLLARMIAHGVRDDTRVDEILIMMDGVRTLQMPHLRLLALLAQRPKVTASGVVPCRWDMCEVVKELPSLGVALNGVAAKLESLALARLSVVEPGTGTVAWLQLTPFGVECAKFLTHRSLRDKPNETASTEVAGG